MQNSNDKAYQKKVHFSIDDCLNSLRFLTENQHQFTSIFDLDFYGKLREYHNKYNASFSLYLFEEKNGFQIQDVCTKYKREFEENKDWLRFGFHGSERLESLSSEESFPVFCEAYKNTKNALNNFASDQAWVDLIRLHRYQATSQEVAFLREQGIKGLLTAHDDERISYDLTSDETAIVNCQGTFNKNDIKYQKTNLCVEFMSDELEELVCYEDKEELVIFAHEWKFKQKINKLDKIMEWLEANSFTFL